MVSQLLRWRINSANQVTEEAVILGTYHERDLPGARERPSTAFLRKPALTRSARCGPRPTAPSGWAVVTPPTRGNVNTRALRTYDETSMSGKLMHIDRNGMGLPAHPFCPTDTNLSHVCTKVHPRASETRSASRLRPGGGIALGDVGSSPPRGDRSHGRGRPQLWVALLRGLDSHPRLSGPVPVPSPVRRALTSRPPTSIPTADRRPCWAVPPTPAARIRPITPTRSSSVTTAATS